MDQSSFFVNTKAGSSVRKLNPRKRRHSFQRTPRTTPSICTVCSAYKDLQRVNSLQFFRNRQSWQYWQFHNAFKFDNKLKIVISDISFAIRMYLVRNYFQFTYIRSYTEKSKISTKKVFCLNCSIATWQKSTVLKF